MLGSIISEGHLKKIKNRARRLFRPLSIYLCHQKPNPARETVSLIQPENYLVEEVVDGLVIVWAGPGLVVSPQGKPAFKIHQSTTKQKKLSLMSISAGGGGGGGLNTNSLPCYVPPPTKKIKQK